MENKVVESFIAETIGEYGIIRSKEKWYLEEDGKVFVGRTQVFYDVCLEHGEGDIVASFNRISEARKWAKEN